MSSTSTPPWVPVFRKQLDGNEKDQQYNVYALSTLTPDGLPKARFVIHRALTPASSLLITTTDTRMAKPKHLAAHPVVELAWWLDPTAIQFRITGSAYTLPSQATPEGKEAVAKAVEALGASGNEADPSWWEEKRMTLWKDAMSGHLRASFARPQPGKPLSEVPDPKTWPTSLKPESDDPEEKKNIEYALSHFALLAIKVDAFECLELKPTPNIRTQWSRNGDGWKEVSVAP